MKNDVFLTQKFKLVKGGCRKCSFVFNTENCPKKSGKFLCATNSQENYYWKKYKQAQKKEIPKTKKNGVLHNKTKKMKDIFFSSLYDFYKEQTFDSMMFFCEQFLDLLPKEKIQFIKWINKNKNQKNEKK